MNTYTGLVEYKPTGQESKSEGFAACLITSSGTSHRLYRKGAFEINDSFFRQFDRQEVEINGELEDTGFICVTSVRTSEGKLIPVPEPSLPSDLTFRPKEGTDAGTGDTDEKKEPAKSKAALIFKKKKRITTILTEERNEYE